jgi:hypothetical protein
LLVTNIELWSERNRKTESWNLKNKTPFNEAYSGVRAALEKGHDILGKLEEEETGSIIVR